MEHNRTPMADVEDDVTFWNGTPEQLAERLAPYVELGFETIISEHPAPYNIESIERLIGQVKPRSTAADRRAARLARGALHPAVRRRRRCW